jgi:hypothetical protein
MIVFFCGCKQKEDLRKVTITLSIPVVNENNNVELFTSSYTKIRYKSFDIYELPYRESFYVNGTYLADSVQSEYFVFKRSDDYGYLFNSQKDSTGSRLKIKETIATKTLNRLQVDTLLKYAAPQRIITKYDNGLKKVSYGLKHPGYDSVFFYFNKELRSLDYTLSKKLDEMYKSKLYRIELKIAPNANIPARYSQQYRRISIQIRTSPVENSDDIKAFCNRLQKEQKKRKKQITFNDENLI